GHHVGAGVEQRVAQVRADEAAGAGDQGLALELVLQDRHGAGCAGCAADTQARLDTTGSAGVPSTSRLWRLSWARSSPKRSRPSTASSSVTPSAALTSTSPTSRSTKRSASPTAPSSP